MTVIVIDKSICIITAFVVSLRQKYTSHNAGPTTVPIERTYLKTTKISSTAYANPMPQMRTRKMTDIPIRAEESYFDDPPTLKLRGARPIILTITIVSTKYQVYSLPGDEPKRLNMASGIFAWRPEKPPSA